MPYPLTKNAPTPPFDGTEACAGVGASLFFSRERHDIDAARTLCAACPMLAACGTWSLMHEEFGLWAGRSADERNRLRRERGITLHRPEARGTRRPSVKHLATAA